jgi:DNA-binding transcriptional ArsR family regulator
MTKALPPHIRPIAFAGAELALDIIHGLRQIFQVDIESALILLCVDEATMRPMMLETGLTEEQMRAPRLPPELRGSISRLMVAERTGLPRETVRRKIKELKKAGYLTVDKNDRVQITAMLDNPQIQNTLETGHRAVLRYLERLRKLNVDPYQPFKS